MFTDTDSLVYEIKTDDAYEDFYENKNLFDFSDYPRDSKLFDPFNEKVIGKMKEEFKGEINSEFVGWSSKMYSFVSVDGKENKKAKAVIKNVVKITRHKELVDVLFNKKIMRHNMKRWKEFKVSCIELELMMFVKFLCLLLMIKDTY